MAAGSLGIQIWCYRLDRDDPFLVFRSLCFAEQITLGGIHTLIDTRIRYQKSNEESFPWESLRMTYLETAYRYQNLPGEAELRAIDSVREVYGIQRIQFNEKEKTVRVLFDASRFKTDAVAKLLRQAGIDVREQMVLA